MVYRTEIKLAAPFAYDGGFSVQPHAPMSCWPFFLRSPCRYFRNSCPVLSNLDSGPHFSQFDKVFGLEHPDRLSDHVTGPLEKNEFASTIDQLPEGAPMFFLFIEIDRCLPASAVLTSTPWRRGLCRDIGVSFPMGRRQQTRAK